MTKDWEKEFHEQFWWDMREIRKASKRGTWNNLDLRLKNFIAKQRTQLLKEVREKVIEIKAAYLEGDLELNIKEKQLKKLKELEEGK